MDPLPGWVPLVFFWIAFFYSMVGFGGGSSYLAVLVLAGLSYQSVPALALVCNLVVAGTGFFNYRRQGHFVPSLIFPFLVLSVPLAYAGGRISVGRELFTVLLGLSLFAAGVRMMLNEKPAEGAAPLSARMRWAAGLAAGGSFGFLSGLVGIGGGVFLSPFLLLMKWADAKQAACAASLFITLNSAAGLAGQLGKGQADFSGLAALAASVFFGGLAGSRLGAGPVPKPLLTRLLAGLVIFVSVKLLLRGL
ncbi:MAG: sulfite exporter TauE/SafE family protein [Candidatus Omnitrophica bacterium]|nr:sulfite exporter TauE/SafE family protein [Candidatus Omnitrophota bacterium]